MTYQTPCQGGDADDWFIDRSGRQYGDDSIATEAEHDDAVRAAQDAVDGRLLTPDELEDVYTTVEEEAKRQALIRRRRAKDACYTCYFRTNCLGLAIQNVESTGTWGGYFEEELSKIHQLRFERRKRGL